LWSFFHSSNDRLNGFNTPGVNDTYLDSLLDTIKTSLVLGDVIDAAKEAQYLLMGGGAPMADYALCYIPIYSRNYFDSYNPDFTGMINMAGYSSDNSWTARNMEYGTETQYTYIIGTEPYNFNPLYSRASDEIACWGPVLGGGIAVNPYTGKDFPFEVTEWDYAEIASGMIINFTLRDGVEWHDGTYFTAEDAKFSWDYLYEFQPATWIDVWNFYDNCTIVEAAGPTGGGKVSVYVTTTSLWLVYDYAGTISMLQKDVWSHVGPAGTTLTKDPGTTIDGTLYNGDPLDFECWKTNHPADVDITDPTTATTFKLTCLVGTGDWIWKGYNEPGLYCELVANRDWWMSQTELTDTLKDMFYHYGDASKDTVKVDITDLSLAGLAFGTWPGKTGWNPDCDLAPDAWPFGEGYAHGSWGDNIVDIEDLRHIGAAFGKQREYP
jgi:ABC-type transport system substrate-binding protein